MTSTTGGLVHPRSALHLMERARLLDEKASRELWISTDRLFLKMLPFQLLGCILIAIFITPRAWDGTLVNARIWESVLAGVLISAYPIYLVRVAAGSAQTRCAIAVAQMMIGVLLIHLTGGRIESHFHVFGSLAFLAFYRENRILYLASTIVVADHAIRGILLPLSVFGVDGIDILRVLEHGGWVAFENFFLLTVITELRAGQKRLAYRQAEIEFAKSAVELEVQDRTRDLERNREDLQHSNAELAEARDKALEAVRAKARFLANISHEIRTPMNGVLGMLGLLRQTSLTTEQEDYAQTAQRSGEALLYLLDEILDFSKLEADRMLIEEVPFDLQAVVEDVGDLLSPKAGQKSLDFVIDYRPGIPRQVIGDPNRVRQVLLNLVGNALKFTESGHVAVLVHADDITEHSATFRFVVEDTGIGISPDAMENLFGEFTQADPSTTRKYGGTGLGLAIAKRIAERMRGSLEAVSRFGAGSTFTFSAPLILDPSPNLIEAPTVDFRRLHVLVVDDNEVNRQVLANQMEHRGIAVTAVEGAREALAVMRLMARRGEPFPIAILDYLMPDTDGLMLGRQIKEDPMIGDTRLFALTSCGTRDEEACFRDAGFSAYFTKPLRVEHLLQAMAAVWLKEQPPLGASMITRHSLRQTTVRKTAMMSLPAGSKGVVLLVEDNAVNRKLGEQLLQRMGFEVMTAGDGAAAVEMVRNCSFQMVFMDCEMPVMDGYEATRRIRKLPGEIGQVPIIALTANVLTEDRERCFQAGMNEFIPKPLDIRRLEAAVHNWVTPLEGSLH